jgi:hypothetical protein
MPPKRAMPGARGHELSGENPAEATAGSCEVRL